VAEVRYAEMTAQAARRHPGRVIFPKPKVTKLDLARHHEAMADRMLPHVARRPLSPLRLPDGIEGERFFRKHPGKGFVDVRM
jgi:bifunctional non-homologous end joining protein LigD